jgi:hypothetical protein
MILPFPLEVGILIYQILQIFHVLVVLQQKDMNVRERIHRKTLQHSNIFTEKPYPINLVKIIQIIVDTMTRRCPSSSIEILNALA